MADIIPGPKDIESPHYPLERAFFPNKIMSSSSPSTLMATVLIPASTLYRQSPHSSAIHWLSYWDYPIFIKPFGYKMPILSCCRLTTGQSNPLKTQLTQFIAKFQSFLGGQLSSRAFSQLEPQCLHRMLHPMVISQTAVIGLFIIFPLLKFKICTRIIVWCIVNWINWENE